MYKVFVNEKAVVLTEICDLESIRSGMLYVQYEDFEELHYLLSMLEQRDDLRGVIIQSSDLAGLWADFRAHFREIEAAGGVVKNMHGQILFIHRLGKWDLPKGKREPGESIEDCAAREVEEECGIEHIVLSHRLPDTYHTYTLRGERILKRTYWFEMHSDATDLKPQAEEGIEKVEWIHPGDVDWRRMDTYPNIRLLLENSGMVGS